MLSPAARFHRFTFRFGRRHAAHGFDVRALLPDRGERAAIFGKVDAALALLAAHDPLRYGYLRRDVRRIWVTGLPAATAQYLAELGMCVLDFDYVAAAATTPEHVAQTLVHEGAHARLRRAGFGYGEAVRARVERVCVGQEAALARKLPGGAALVADAEARLEYPAGFFTNAAGRQRELAELPRLGRGARLAFWLARALGRLRRRGAV